jgi:hypothetical protein
MSAKDVVPYVVLGVAAGLAIVIPVFVVRLDRKRFKGIPASRRRAVMKRGGTAEATVLDRNEVGVRSVGQHSSILYHLADLVLEVRPPGAASYRAPCRQEFIGSQWMDLQEGTIVPVRIDAADPQLVYVDIDARVRAEKTAREADREAHTKRQHELLSRKP